MWEITLVGKTRDLVYFEQIKYILRSKYKNNVIVVIASNCNVFMSIAVKNKRYIKKIKLLVIELILKICKCEFYENSLEIFSNDKSLNSFIITTIIQMDLLDEIEYVYNHYELESTIYLRSFMHFKLNRIIEIWKDIAGYLNINYSNNNDKYLCLEFLKFVADNSQPKLELIFLNENNNSYNLKDINNKNIASLSKSDEVGVVVSLILHAPKRIIISCVDSLSEKISILINYIFGTKVGFLY